MFSWTVMTKNWKQLNYAKGWRTEPWAHGGPALHAYAVQQWGETSFSPVWQTTLPVSRESYPSEGGPTQKGPVPQTPVCPVRENTNWWCWWSWSEIVWEGLGLGRQDMRTHLEEKGKSWTWTRWAFSRAYTCQALPNGTCCVIACMCYASIKRSPFSIPHMPSGLSPELSFSLFLHLVGLYACMALISSYKDASQMR